VDIEALAVSEISSMIASCPHLKAYISTNDKTPFTDGYIDLYSGLRQNKEEWTGRVPVQVKGRTLRSRKGQPTHPISRTDLLAYQKDSGVLYFVVTVDPRTARRTPYYALLSPFAIQSILNGVHGDQGQVSVSLKGLPKEPNSIERIVTLALKTRDQNLSLGFDPVLLERLESFTVHTASDLNLEAPVTLTPGATDFALVLNTTDGLSVPLGGELRIFPQDYLKSVDIQVGSGAITYEGAAISRIEQETFEAEISDGLKLVFRSGPGRQSTNVSLTLERTLAGRLKALEFYVALLDTQVIAFNGRPSPFEITKSEEDAWLREHLDTLRALTDLFDHLDVDTDLVDLDQIDEVQTRQLNILHRAFVQDREITDVSAKTARVLQRVGQWNLMFLITSGSAPDKWRFVDPFSTESRRQFRWRADEESLEEAIPVTAYDVVEEEHLGTVLNMRLDSIVGAYEAIADFASTFALANQRVLALITAADASEPRKEVLLDAAASLNDWLIAEQGDEPHHLINRWQISWRRDTLSVEQRSEIRQLKRHVAHSGADNADQAEVACALLLGDEEEVDDLLRQLPAERLDQLKKWPIWRLRNSPDDAQSTARGSRAEDAPARDHR
jgi:hypothetical protein